MNTRAIVSLVFFTMVLILAIIVGNAFLSFVLQRPIEQVPTFAKVIVHGISMTILFIILKKVLIK